ncbi:golgin subfamily B member 1-like isoform X3 [Gopherus evgoodei]|uniref:golgin subfamily B member 1-like isoform X3 n=1 Tax=Gopherus evgoodei TaxID=1825980 RepID=UPI0011CFDD96|nr:golgin subfamily B member 1-like isoform X3 [Gopherus evgoodei]
MWKWGTGDDSSPKAAAYDSQDAANMSVADLTEQLTHTEQLVTQLKELIREKDNELRNRDNRLKEEKEASEAKLSKVKLQNKAKVTSLTSQLEELKKQLSGSEGQEKKAEEKKRVSRDGDQENAAANRGKLLVLRRRVEELEFQNTHKNEELQKKIAELEAQRQRGAEMDAMLAEKEKKLAEKEAYIIDLQLACDSGNVAKGTLVPSEELKNQLSVKESSLQSMQILVQNLTKKVGDSEERCSLLQEQIESLKNLQSKERDHFQEREAMYIENIRMFQNIIQEKEKELIGQAQKHEQELFKLIAKSDASADLEQLLKALKQKLHEKEEVMLGRTQVIVMLQKELDGKDQLLKEINENLKRLQSEKENLQSKLDAEKHVMRAQLRDMMEKHELEMTKVQEKHNAEVHEIQEKHETELQEKDQALLQLQKQVAELRNNGESNSKQSIDVDTVTKQKMEQLEAQMKLKTEEASKSEAKFLKMKAWSKSKIKQLEDELKSVHLSSKNNDIAALKNCISELEIEKKELQSKLKAFSELRTQNEELLAKLEVYEEQQRKLQADLEQVTKRAASQASESGSVDEFQSQLLEWQDIVPESEEVHDQVREEKSAIALRMAQIEEEREELIEDDWFFPGCSDPAIVSGQQELEEELTAVQRTGRLQQARKKSNQTIGKHQEEYSFDRKQCFQELSVTLDITDSAEGENMGGLRTVVEELELERNQLQEQILILEERCQDLEDRLQLQGRMEALQVTFGVEEEGQPLRAVQSENERLQTQLSQLRTQQMRDAEKHQVLVSSFNEQLKGLSDRKSFLETSLAEKEQKLLSTMEKLEQIENLRQLLQEKDLLNKELGEKLVQTEQKLDEVLKKYNAYEVECTEQKIAINDLTEKVSTFKEKTLKQDTVVELMQLELNQTNEELDRLNTNHLEERSQLIQDLQRREREIDNLKEVLVEKDKEMSALSSSMTEYSEQIVILKRQIQCKEEEIREMEEALTKAERETHLLKEVQTADVRDTSMKISVLSEQSNIMGLELEKFKSQTDAKTKENEELIRQISENSITIKDLRSEIKSNKVTYHNKLMECESQITLLKEQINKTSEKLQETETKHREETKYLKSQLDENSSIKEKLKSLLKEKENKEQSFEKELKSVKELYNKLVLEAANKDEELAKLSRQLAEHTERQETVKKVLREKLEMITSLEQKLQIVEQQSEETKHKLIGDLKAKEMQFEELKNHVTEREEIVSKMEAETQTVLLINKQLQAALEGKEKDLSEQIKGNEDLRNIIDAVEKEKQQLANENESLSKLLDMNDCELLKRNKVVAEMENKLSVSETEYQKTLSELNYGKEVLMKKVEQLSTLVEQKENSVTEQLLEKTKECNVLTNQLSESRELTQELHEQIQSFIIQLKDAKDREVEKEEMLNSKLAECNTLVQQLSQSEEKILLLQKQIQDITVDFEVKEEQILHNVSLRKQVEENKVDMEKLQDEVRKLKETNIKLSQSVEERDFTIKNQYVELENLHKQVAEKTEKNAMLNNQVELLRKEGVVLKHEKEDISVICSKKSSECADLQSHLTQHQSEIVSVKHQAHILNLENEKLKVDIETVNATVLKKSDEISALTSHMSQQDDNILALKHQIDSLTIENEKLKIGVEEKEALLSEKEALIQQMKENKVAGEGQHLKIISDLQNQVQALSSETSQLREAAQEKEIEFKKQTQELKLFKDKSEESDLLRFQLSENMEIISDLQCQLKNMVEKTAELNQSVIQKDESLKQKIDEYVNLKAHISEVQESFCMQQKQLESLTSEAEQLKTIVLEKELAVSCATLVNDKLKTDLHDKERECEVLRNQVTDLEEATLKLKKEINDQKKVINDISQSMLEKESSLVEKTSLLKKLSDRASEDEEKIQLVSQLQSQMHELTQEIQKSKELAQEKENAFLSLQEKFAAQYEQRNTLNVSLSKKEEVIAGLLNSVNEKDVSVQLAERNICALTNEIEMLREELEKSAAAVKSLTSVLQEKDDSFAINQKKIDSLTVELDSVKREHLKAQDQINIWKQDTQQKELTLQTLYVQCTEQAKNIEHLKSELNNVHFKSSQDCRDSALVIERLQQQVDSLVKEKILLQEIIDKLIVENKELITYQTQLQQKTEELQEIHEKLVVTENYSRMQIDAVKLEMKNEKEQLQMQVSVKGEEVSELKLKIEKLEQSLVESENKWVTDLNRATQQNAILKEQLSSLESEMKPKDGKIQSLQQELDVIKEELTKSLSALLSSRHFFKEKDAETSDVGQQVSSSKTKLERFSAMVSTILSKEMEGEEFQLLLLEKEKEMDIIKDKLKSMQLIEKEKELLQNDLEKVKNTCHSEIECLSKEMATVKDTLYKQQSLVEEREKMLSEMNKEVNLLQEKLDKSEKDLKISHEKLNIEGNKIMSLLEEMKEKDLHVENLTSEANQQSDIISALNQQLKEKDCFVAQVMESMSNEMVKFSEERNILNTKLQHLEALQSSLVENINRVSQQLEDCKTELQHNQVKLSNKETAFNDLLSEKEQLQFNLEKLVKEKEILKKKLQAALIIRKDLMQKVGKLERIGQEEIEEEHKKMEELLKRVDELTHQLKLVETQNKDLESHLETLKQQLFEKESKINNMNESFSAKVFSLEQLKDSVAKLKDVLAEKEKVSEQNLKSMQEKDSMLAHMQSVLSEKDREYGEERSQLLATLENLKAEIVDEEELLKDTNLVEAYVGDIGGNSVDFNNEVSQPGQLEGDKEILQKKLQASLLTWKENIKKLKKEKKEYAKLVAVFDEQTKDLELLKNEHKALQEVHQRKCKEFDCNQLLIYSLRKELESHVAALQGQETIDQSKLESVEQKYEVKNVLGESEQAVFEMTVKDSELEKLSNDYTKLCEEIKRLKDELRKTAVELGEKTEETVNLKNSVSQLEQHYEQHKDSLLVEIGQLQEKLEKYETEVMDLKTMIERMNNEKETIIKKSVEDYKTIQKESEKLKVDLEQANIQVAEKNEEIKELRCTLMDFKDKFDQEKEILKEAVQLQLSLQESQKEAKHFKMAFEDMKREREEFINSLEKSNAELLNMRKELKHFSEENKELLMELSTLREKAVEASEVSNTMVLCKKVKDKNATDKEPVQSHSENDLLHGRLQNRHICVQSLELDHSDRAKLIEGTNYQIQKQSKPTPEQIEKNINVDEFQPQEQKNAADEKPRERLQRKLQAALISRKEALKENKFLKDQVDRIMLEKEELTNKACTLERLLSELGREKQNSDTVSSLCEEETLVSENARLLTENENLTAACESLKSTMETIVQEKEAFSFQLNTLKDSQTVELTGWKAKHNELKQEYESLLQAYENISSKIAEMRQVIDVTRKEKQEAIHRLSERESEKHELEKQLQEVINENKDIKDQLKPFAESKQLEIDELQSEAERQTHEHASRMEEYQHHLHEAALQNKQLMEENEQLKHTSENLKQALEKTENENEVFHNDMNVTRLALENLQVQMEVSQTDMQSKISDVLNERESLLKQIALLNDDISIKERNMRILEQKRELISERVKETEESLDQKNNCLSKLENESRSLRQEIVSLNERVKILEDDKCLLQEELENVQETSYKVKNEREFLETELLNHIKKVDQLTDRLKSAQLQNNLLIQQLEDLKAEKCSVIREKEEQQLHLVKVFEEKVKCAQRNNSGTKNKTKELQELLKEKQQEINQLQKDSIKFQELILDLERSVKLSQSKSEKFEKDLNNTTERLAKSNEEIDNLNEKLSSQKALLDESKSELERLAAENLSGKRELKKKEDQLQIQRREFERELELGREQLKTVHKREWLNLEERHNILQREKDRAVSELHQLQEEINIKDSQNKKLQANLNTALARLAAFTKCMSSLQNDRDRVIGEMKTWEIQFREVIQNKEKQMEDSSKKIMSLQEEMKDKVAQIQELTIKYSMLEESKNEMHLWQKAVDTQHYSELCRIKEENVTLINRQQELEIALQSKEEALQALLKENNSLNHLIEHSSDAGREIKALESNFARKEQELQQLLFEKEKIHAELEKQIAISQQMKVMLNNKDTEISLLISSKGGEISGYLTQIQTQHRKQINEYEQQIRSLQKEREQSDEACQRMENELKNLQIKAHKAIEDKAEIASEIDAFKKSMSSLQYDRDDLFSKYKDLEHHHQNVLSQKDSLLVNSASENSALKQELRKLLNRIDDLHSENAMQSAQLIKYREDLNQVLSLKDHQLKELLKQQLDCIKNLEQEKTDLQKQIKEMQLTNKLQKESTESLEHENQKLTSKVKDLESLISSINKGKLVSESGEKPQTRGSGQHQNEDFKASVQPGEKLQDKFQEVQNLVGKNTKDVEDKYSMTAFEHNANFLWKEADASSETRLLEAQFQNKKLRSQNESFGKAMTALQDDRDRLIEDFKVLQSKYASELKSEKKRADELEADLNYFKSNLFSVLKEHTFLNPVLIDGEKKITLDQLADEIENLCKTIITQDSEITRLSSERGNYVQQIDAFSKSMASLQDDRDRLLQELSKSKAKEGASLASVEIAKLKTKVDDLERALHRTKAFQEETEIQISSYQNELAGLRMEKNLLLTESQTLRNQYQMAVADKDRQIAELQKLQHDMIVKESVSIGSNYPIKPLETVTLVGSTNSPEQVKRLLAERSQLQNELQRCLQEMHQRELRFQQMNSKVMQSVEENAVLSAQLKTVSQTLRENQLRYTDLQNRYFRLEREYQTVQVSSFQDTAQGESRAEVPPGAPQERTAVIVEIDNMELDELRKRLAETEQQYDSVQQALSQLTETLSEERSRREAAEEALGLTEEQCKRLEMSSYRSVPREYTVQMESEEEREALIINPSEHIVVRKMKGGALSFKRWLRGRSLYCSKLLTSRAKSRYLFLTYLVTLHLLVFLCLTGIL